MTRFVLALLGVLCASGVLAQDAPQVTVTLDESQVMVGQPLVLRIKVLVPTYLPKPPVFPSFEVPGLMVRLPERASGPVSEHIEGATWAGVQRAYRLYPLQAGPVTLPGQAIQVTYADPEDNSPVEVTVPLEPIRFTATLPAAAADLDPPILAEDFTLEQTLEAPETLKVGDAVTRTISARIAGTTAVLIPSLTPEITGETVRAYGDEPKVAEQSDRAELSGTRAERTTYVAQQEGSFALPALTLDWFNVKTGKVETATLPGSDFVIAPTALLPQNDPLALLNVLLPWIAAALGLALILWRIRPGMAAGLTRLQIRWQASEVYAFRALRLHLRQNDLQASLSALDRWIRFHPTLSDAATETVRLPLSQVWRARQTGDATDALWRQSRTAAHRLRAQQGRAARARRRGGDLPALNTWRSGT